MAIKECMVSIQTIFRLTSLISNLKNNYYSSNLLPKIECMNKETAVPLNIMLGFQILIEKCQINKLARSIKI